MTGEQWRPLGQDPAEASALYEGMPIWLQHSVWEWLREALMYEAAGFWRWRQDVLASIDRQSRRSLPLTALAEGGSLATIRSALGDDGVLMLLDYCIAHPEENEWTADPAKLEHALLEGGSAWKVGIRDGCPGLERRVPAGVQEAAEQAMATPGHAGARLSEAWHAVYGVRPNPTHAYAMAVKAVEDAAVPIVVRRQAGATLGHVIGQLRADGDWSLPLTREDPSAPTSETVVRMCQALWKGHHDRHGGDPEAPESVDQTEAETAVMLAVPLVQWFASGAVARR